MIVGIILAAGTSSRMGTSKALMTIGNRSFIRTIVEVYGKSRVDRIIVVTQPQAKEIEKELSGLKVSFAPNPDFRQGQLSSVIAGLDAACQFQPDAVLVHPVDHPVITESVIDAIIDLYKTKFPLIIVPAYRGKRGHPVLFNKIIFQEIKNAPADVGARKVVWQHSDQTAEFAVEEEGVILDIDTPDDYENLRRIIEGVERR